MAEPIDPWSVVVPASSARSAPGTLPSFSVVVAAYQAKGTIAEAISSALTQTYPALEIIVCDDGSTDGTARVLETFGAQITVIRQDNQGEAAAKNAGVRRARGDYVALLDADDVYFPRRLEALAWLAAHHPDLDILVTDALVEAGGIPVRRAYHAGWPFPATNQRLAILDRNFVLGLCAVRRSRWDATGGFDRQLAYAADWEFWLRLVLSGSQVGLVSEPLARYRLSVGSLSSNRIPLVEARLEVLSRASGRSDLTPDERRVVTLAIGRERRDLARRLATVSLARGGWQSRKQFARILLRPGFKIRERLGALIAVASPGLAARRRSRRSDSTVEIGAGLRVERRGG